MINVEEVQVDVNVLVRWDFSRGWDEEGQGECEGGWLKWLEGRCPVLYCIVKSPRNWEEYGC